MAVIVSVYAAGAVPGQFVPGLQAAFLTSAAFARRPSGRRGLAAPRRVTAPVARGRDGVELAEAA